ncbi:MAG: rRNA maturation RNase YbeY [Chloroflexi bacterium]|nr:rRNA maturation RNase YbeY [Chloroflexota bacterium]
MSTTPVPPRTRVQVFQEFEGCASRQWLESIAKQALAAAYIRQEKPADATSRAGPLLDIVLADDDTMKRLNQEHRGLDETTDVLAFSFAHGGEYYGDDRRPPAPDGFDFVTPPGEEAGLGEVIISYPQAVRQARQSGHGVHRELVILLVHGVLHLLGYDHMEPDEEAAMKEMETAVLAQVLSIE